MSEAPEVVQPSPAAEPASTQAPPVVAPSPSTSSTPAAAPVPGPAVKHVFISYHWRDQPAAVKLNQDLKRRGYATWLDIDRVGDSTLLEGINNAISNAFVIVALVSSAYNHSNNCRKELELSRDLEATTGYKIPLIPVIVENGFKPSPWLEFFINGLSQYQSEDYSGIAKKLWSLMDQVNKQQGSSSKGAGTEKRMKMEELVSWIGSLTSLSDQDLEACARFRQISEELAQEEIRKRFAKDVLPALTRLLQGTTNRNPRITKSLLRGLIHYGLDNSQAAALRSVLSEQFYAALDKIIAMAGISDVWETCASLARDMLYLSTTGSLDSGKKKVMISYHWDAKVLANRMFDFFKSHATNWEVVDIENMSGGAGSGMEKTAAAIASCSALIVIVSQGYETSANCKSELMSAKKWGKPMIFVQPDPTYNGGSSWLGFEVRDETCYDLFDPNRLEAKLSEIVKVGFVKAERSGGQGSSSLGPMSALLPTVAQARGLPVVQMQGPDDVKSWLESTVGLSPGESSLFELVEGEGIDGQCVRALAGMSVVDLKSFLRLSKLSDVLKLKAALEDLY